MAIALSAAAQQAEPQSQQPDASTPAQQPHFEERVDVVAVTPIHGFGLPKERIPANVQVFTAGQIDASTLDVAGLLADRAASVHVSDAHGGTFQPDVLFRGFTGSPLLGASEGLAVYQDGVRMNEAFGDTINWDALPTAAIASINLTPGSNPLFGLNALGGALSIRTKNGFDFPGRKAFLSTGSFGRHRLQAEAGGHGASVAYFVAGSLIDDGGWREHSPSTIRRVFGDVAWRGSRSSLNASVSAASNDMTGNGSAPVGLLAESRAAVFTYPDRTDNDLGLVTLRGQHRASADTALDAVAYYRRSRIGTFNGDAADDDDAGDNGAGGHEAFDGLNNIARTRGSAGGATGQLTRTTPLWGKSNHLILGAGMDAASTLFDFASEWALLTADRGTVASGLFDDDAAVRLRSRTVTASAFATDTWSLTRAIALTGSVRFNWTEVKLRDRIGTALTGDHQFGRMNPAAGITYQIRPTVNVYGSYSQSSRVPTPVELTCADPDDPCRLPNAFVSDPPLDQVVAHTWEAGARGHAGPLAWSLSTFRTAAADDIIFVSSGTLRGEGHFENVERTRRRGLEAAFDYVSAGGLSAFGAYTLQDATFGTDLRIASHHHPLAREAEIAVTSGSRLPGIPTHTAKLGITAPVTTGLTVGVSARAQSAQYLRGDEANLLAQVPGFAVLDGSARQRITNRVAAVVQVQNVMDTGYYTFGVLGDAELLGDAYRNEPRFYSPGAPRAAWVGLDVRF